MINYTFLKNSNMQKSLQNFHNQNWYSRKTENVQILINGMLCQNLWKISSQKLRNLLPISSKLSKEL